LIYTRTESGNKASSVLQIFRPLDVVQKLRKPYKNSAVRFLPTLNLADRRISLSETDPPLYIDVCLCPCLTNKNNFFGL